MSREQRPQRNGGRIGFGFFDGRPQKNDEFTAYITVAILLHIRYSAYAVSLQTYYGIPYSELIHMKPSDQKFLRTALDDFIGAGITRSVHSGDMNHAFVMSSEEFKDATNRQRLHENLVDEVIEFFADAQIHADYNDSTGMFNINLNLSQCAMNRQQAKHLTAALEIYRAENG